MVSVNASIPYIKRQVAANPTDNKEVELVRLVDGVTCVLLHDGPNRPDSQGNMPPPGVGTTRILKNVRKRDAQGNPMWVATKPGVRIYDPQIEDWREIPALNDEHKKIMAAHIKAREERNDAGGRAQRLLVEQKEAEKNAATEAVVVNALAKVLGKADAPATKKGGAA